MIIRWNYGCILFGQHCIPQLDMNRKLCLQTFLLMVDGSLLFLMIEHWKSGHRNRSNDLSFVFICARVFAFFLFLCWCSMVIETKYSFETFILIIVEEDYWIKVKCFEKQKAQIDFLDYCSMSDQFANLHEYIASLPANVTQNIYGHPASCLAIFRFVTKSVRSLRMIFQSFVFLVNCQFLQERSLWDLFVCRTRKRLDSHSL